MRPIVQERSFNLIMLGITAILYAGHCLTLYKFGVGQSTFFWGSGLLSIFQVGSIYLIANNLYYYRPKSFSIWYILIWAFFFNFITVALSDYLAQLIFPERALAAALNKIFYTKLIFGFLLYLVIAMACFLWYTLAENKEVELRKSEMQILSKEAELNKLRLQLQPHFLFNSLNSINALIGAKPSDARKMVQQLSDFLRFTVRKSNNELVSFEEEMQHLNLYLDIEKVRFGHRLETQVQGLEVVKVAQIPALILQPIVENAIKYGLYDTLDGVKITIDCTMINGDLVVEIVNPYDAATSIAQKGTGFGLSSIRKRLSLLYNRADLLQIKKEEQLFTAILKIPQTI